MPPIRLTPFWLLVISRKCTIGLPCLFLYLEASGLSPSGIGWCLGALALSQILLEVPSGIASDLLGRRNTLIVGALCRTAAWTIIALAPSYYTFIVGFSLYGAAFAFDSGTDSAFLYDTLKDHNLVEDYPKLEARAQTWAFMSMGAATLAGGFLIPLGYHVPIAVTIVPMALGIVAAWALIEPSCTKASEDTKFFVGLFPDKRARLPCR